MNDKRRTTNRTYDIIVVGGGHAGCEAALASARMGLNTLLLTINLSKIALMPCNPSVGGIGKGHLVREIDALGGEMAKNIDKSKIQIKTLNKSKGPAVRALRAQADKRLYEAEMRRTILNQKNLTIKQGLAEKVLEKAGKASGIELATGEKYKAKALIITSGTFLGGRIVIGRNSWAAGRMGEQSAKGLSGSLKTLGIETERFQTATPPRVDGRTLDYSKMEKQEDEDGLHFSLDPPEVDIKKKDCYLTYTNNKTVKVITKNIKHSPIRSGEIESHGPRYCPSIDRKIINFPDKEKHPVFIEPEGLMTNEMYLQGMTTAMPATLQEEIIRTVKGLEKAKIVRFGYAVEYDYIPPEQLKFTLESKQCENLYLAGQLIGTTGYEEAAALGLMAGINASLKLKNKGKFVLGRDEAYIGVLIDDLITKGVDEPYRMFTSRAEYRLVLRNDNAHERLSKKGYQVGLINKKTLDKVNGRIKKLDNVISTLQKRKYSAAKANKILSKYHQTKTSKTMTAAEILSRPHVEINRFIKLDGDQDLIKDAEIKLKYGGYIKRQQTDINRSRKFEKTLIPEKLDYLNLNSLSFEAREKLNKVRPETLGQASRIPGVTPADVSVLTIYIKQGENGRKS